MTTLRDSIEIRATPKKVFNWFLTLKGKADYQSWHPDHVDLHWTRGEPFAEGSIVYFEEYIYKKLLKGRFLCTKRVPGKMIEYRPLFPWSIFMSKGTFVMEPEGQRNCIFTATICLRPGSLFRKFSRNLIEALNHHMKEEGENLKKILEENG
jgi:hypothetical protein